MSTSQTQQKTYLGDGVYVYDDGYGIILTTSDGIHQTNQIYFEPSVLAALIEWLKRRDDVRSK